MSENGPELEELLREALAPVEPGEGFERRLESALTDITELAAEELESWELSAMRDPRNWVRPATALVVGGAAASALVVLRARHRQQAPGAAGHGPAAAVEATERALSELGAEVRKLLGRRSS